MSDPAPRHDYPPYYWYEYEQGLPLDERTPEPRRGWSWLTSTVCILLGVVSILGGVTLGTILLATTKPATVIFGLLLVVVGLLPLIHGVSLAWASSASRRLWNDIFDGTPVAEHPGQPGGLDGILFKLDLGMRWGMNYVLRHGTYLPRPLRVARVAYIVALAALGALILFSIALFAFER